MRDRVLSFTSISGPSLDGYARWSRSVLGKPMLLGLGAVLEQTMHSWYIYVFIAPLGSRVAGNPRIARRWLRALQRIERLDPRHGANVQPEAVRAGIALYRANMRQRLTRLRRVATDVPVQLVVASRDRYVMPATSIGAVDVSGSGRRLFGRYNWPCRTACLTRSISSMPTQSMGKSWPTSWSTTCSA